MVGRGGFSTRGSTQSKNQHRVHAGKTLPHACPHSTDQPAAWKRVVPCVAEAVTACSRGRAGRIRPAKSRPGDRCGVVCPPDAPDPSHTSRKPCNYTLPIHSYSGKASIRAADPCPREPNGPARDKKHHKHEFAGQQKEIPRFDALTDTTNQSY